MELKLADMGDLPRLKEVYQKIIEKMDQDGITIWDEVYPSEFFAEDIGQNRLYCIMDGDEIAAAFALCGSSDGESHVKWAGEPGRAAYIDRLGVNPAYARRGVGSCALRQALAIAKGKGAQSLRLFVVDSNTPAINLYVKNGFQKAEGVYNEVIDEELTLHEYGFERSTEQE